MTRISLNLPGLYLKCLIFSTHPDTTNDAMRHDAMRRQHKTTTQDHIKRPWIPKTSQQHETWHHNTWYLDSTRTSQDGSTPREHNMMTSWETSTTQAHITRCLDIKGSTTRWHQKMAQETWDKTTTT